MNLGNLKPAPGSRRKKKRVGCGNGSGHGGTSCRGHKGQGSRAGGNVRPGFEGGQMPLTRRVPKRGFTNIFRVERQVVNVRDLERFDANTDITIEVLLGKGIIRNLNLPVKLLGEGELTKAVRITVHACSQSARELVEKAGGTVNIVG